MGISTSPAPVVWNTLAGKPIFGTAAVKNIGENTDQVPINPISQDSIDDPRTRAIRVFTQNWINQQIAIETRLRDLRVEVTNLKNFIHGDGLSGDNLATIAEIERKARFRAAVRAEGARLEAIEGATSDDGTWPDLEDFEAQALSAFWTDGISIGSIVGLSAALTGKVSAADVDAQIQAFYDNVAPETLTILTQLATDLANHESLEATILAAVSDEATTRAAGDSSEATARASGDTTNASAITSETAARLSADNTESAARIAADNGKESTIVVGTTSQYLRGDKTWQPLATVGTTGAYADLSGKPTLGTAAAQNTSAFDAAGAAASAQAAAQAASQPVDSDLTAIAALTTTTFGRSLLTMADAAAARSTIGVAAAVVVQNVSISGAYTVVPSPSGSPTRTFTYITSSVASTAVTLGETGIAQGSELKIINVGTNSIIVSDTVGVSESSGNFTLGSQDVIEYIYSTDRWIEAGRSNN